VTGRAFALHGARDATQRERARHILNTCGLEGDLWPAVEGTALSSAVLSSMVGAGIFAPGYPFPLTTPEIARFLSHRQIWAEIVRRDLDFGLIVEQDAALDPAVFSNAVALARDHIDDLGYIRFQTQAMGGPARLIDTNGGSVLSLPLVSAPPCPVQMIGRNAAIHLLHLTESFDRPVDALIQSHWHTGLRAGAIHPSGVSCIAQTRADAERARLTQLWARYLYRRALRHAARHSRAPVTGGLI
jgi:GR25 family glycosyltransferase involved in LPS biosynthesis